MLEMQVTEEQLESIADRTIQEADLDKDDAISFEEFRKVPLGRALRLTYQHGALQHRAPRILSHTKFMPIENDVGHCCSQTAYGTLCDDSIFPILSHIQWLHLLLM